MELLLHAVIENSSVNGPGERYVIWSQGCPHACPGCFNPESWSTARGYRKSVVELARAVVESGRAGVSLSGGDPLTQPVPLLAFLKLLHSPTGELNDFPRGILLWTGYTREEIFARPEVQACLPYLDVVVEGRYVAALRHQDGLSGSSNQTFWWNEAPGRGLARIQPEEVMCDQEVEVHLQGELIQLTGFPAIDRRYLTELGLHILP